jgi:hypothetical protein
MKDRCNKSFYSRKLQLRQLVIVLPRAVENLYGNHVVSYDCKNVYRVGPGAAPRMKFEAKDLKEVV